jgi:hypothetical protein
MQHRHSVCILAAHVSPELRQPSHLLQPPVFCRPEQLQAVFHLACCLALCTTPEPRIPLSAYRGRGTSCKASQSELCKDSVRRSWRGDRVHTARTAALEDTFGICDNYQGLVCNTLTTVSQPLLPHARLPVP